ncbi:MAG TPA: hypothetical protein VD907_06920 [Verrucomicrobiae bacterium]|nr:hypothetical protein [Verrucomicrobiae bacterium]
MEILKLAKLPLEAARFAGKQLLGGAWGELPAMPQGEIRRPVRASISYYSTSPEGAPVVPANISLGEE